MDIRHSLILLKLHVPDLPPSWFDKHSTKCAPYIAHLGKHVNYRTGAEPWLSADELRRVCQGELRACQLGFPGVDDEAIIRVLAAYLGAINKLDDLIEVMNMSEAQNCVNACVDVLDRVVLRGEFTVKSKHSQEQYI